MPITKHKLTTHADKITGGSGKDVFLAPLKGIDPNFLTTLASDDILNGRGGVDTIRATLANISIAPVMKNIERGIFTFNDAAVVGLDLAHARQMTSLIFQSAAHPNSAEVAIDHAAAVSKVAVLHASNDSYQIDELDTVATKSFGLAIDGATNSEIELLSLGSKAFRNLDITLENGSDAVLTGSCVNARNLAITSGGNDGNKLQINPGMHLGTVRNLTVSGSRNLTLYTLTDTYRHLHSFDSTAMGAITWITIGGDELQSVRGGKGAEIMDIASIGGSAASPAAVSLGGGNDYLTLKFAFDAATQYYDGGKDFDTIKLNGAAADLNTAAKNFEAVSVNGASGLYDVQAMKLVNFLLYSTSSAVTINHLVDDATLGIYTDTATFLTVNVAHAASSTTDSMRLLLQNSATLGSTVAGFMAPNLSHLQIDCYSGDHVMYLGSVGSATDGASIEISGAKHLDLRASNNSTSFIESLIITSDAGADISGLVNGIKAFVTAGATITGGNGDDILVGGSGADTISTGGGNNRVYSSLGADQVDLQLNSGADVLIFDSKSQSAYGSGVSVTHFSTVDTIDIGALVTSITSAGDVANLATGIAALSTNHSVAFFDLGNDTLYIDINHDGQLTVAADMQIELTGFSGLQSWNLVG